MAELRTKTFSVQLKIDDADPVGTVYARFATLNVIDHDGDVIRPKSHLWRRFRQGFRALYLASEIEDDAGYSRGTSVGIEHVIEAFRSDDGAESGVIARWYNGTEPYDLSRLDIGPVDPSLPNINGRIDEAYIATSTDGPAVSDFSVRDVTWVYLTLKYSYSVSGGPHEVPLEIVEYFEDGFEFSRLSDKLTAWGSGYIGGTSWWSVGPVYPGRFWIYVYAGERKVAEVQYEVTP